MAQSGSLMVAASVLKQDAMTTTTFSRQKNTLPALADFVPAKDLFPTLAKKRNGIDILSKNIHGFKGLSVLVMPNGLPCIEGVFENSDQLQSLLTGGEIRQVESIVIGVIGQYIPHGENIYNAIQDLTDNLSIEQAAKKKLDDYLLYLQAQGVPPVKKALLHAFGLECCFYFVNTVGGKH